GDRRAGDARQGHRRAGLRRRRQAGQTAAGRARERTADRRVPPAADGPSADPVDQRMTSLTWIVDPATGDTTVEGMTPGEATRLVGDLMPVPRAMNCARPLTSPTLPDVTDGVGPTLRVARIYHGSVVDGPGRRSVVQLQGCPIRCPSCYVPETHDP